MYVSDQLMIIMCSCNSGISFIPCINMQYDDYHQLKCKVTELQRQLSNSENKVSELKSNHKQQQNTIKQLRVQLSQPSLELTSLQDELTQLHETHHKQMLVMGYDNKQLRKQLAMQVECGVRLQKRVDEQLLQLKSAQREVKDLQSLLEHELVHGAFQGSHRGHREGRGNAR